MILGDIEKALESYERLGGTILDLNNEEHLQAVQQVIAAFPEAAKRALAAEARVKELERIRQAAACFLRTLVSGRQQHCARLCDFLGMPMPPLVRNDDVCRQCESGACSVPGMLAILADWEAQSDERLMGVSAIQQAGFRAQAAGRGAC